MFGYGRGGSVAFGALSGAGLCVYYAYLFFKNNKKPMQIKTVIWFVLILILGSIIGGAIAFIGHTIGDHNYSDISIDNTDKVIS